MELKLAAKYRFYKALLISGCVSTVVFCLIFICTFDFFLTFFGTLILGLIALCLSFIIPFLLDVYDYYSEILDNHYRKEKREWRL